MRLLKFLNRDKIYVAVLRTDAIGHLMFHGPNFIKFCENINMKNRIYLFTDKNICNITVFNVIINLLPSNIKIIRTLYPFNLFIRQIFEQLQANFIESSLNIVNIENGFFIIPEKVKNSEHFVRVANFSKHFPIYTEKHLKLLEKQKNSLEFKHKLQIYNIPQNKPVVLVIDRDSSYRAETENSPRNTDPEILEKTIDFLLNKNIFVIRFGNKRLHKLKIKSSELIDYPFSDFRTAYFDYFLALRSDYVISWNTGLNAIPAFQDKPICFLDGTFVIPLLNQKKLLFHPMKYLFEEEELYLPQLLLNFNGDIFDNPDLLELNKVRPIPMQISEVTNTINQFLNEEKLSVQELVVENIFFEDLMTSLEFWKTNSRREYLSSIYKEELFFRSGILSKNFCQNYSKLQKKI